MMTCSLRACESLLLCVAYRPRPWEQEQVARGRPSEAAAETCQHGGAALVAVAAGRAHGPAACVQAYRPRAAEHTVLHRLVRAHLATFLRAAEAAGGVPPFVEREFRQFLGCGAWARGFAVPE
jgi:hypothetical protein